MATAAYRHRKLFIPAVEALYTDSIPTLTVGGFILIASTSLWREVEFNDDALPILVSQESEWIAEEERQKMERCARGKPSLADLLERVEELKAGDCTKTVRLRRP